MERKDFEGIVCKEDWFLNTRWEPPTKFIPTPKLKKLFPDGFKNPGFIVRGLTGPERTSVNSIVSENCRKAVTSYCKAVIHTFAGIEHDVLQDIMNLFDPKNPDETIKGFYYFLHGVVEPTFSKVNKYNIGMQLHKYQNTIFAQLFDEILKLTDAGYTPGE